MLKSLAPRLLTAAALMAFSTSATAHRQWLLPSITILSGTDSWITVDAAVSNDLFYPDHVALQTDGIKVTRPDGSHSEIQNAATGRHRSTFDVQIDRPGTWKIGNASQSYRGSFKLDGKDWTVGRRRGPAAQQPDPQHVTTIADIPSTATDIKLTEMLNRNEIFITADAPTTDVLKPAGHGLEFDPVSHPDDLVADEAARFRFLVDGKPAANLKVTVIAGSQRFRDTDATLELTTDADGMVTVEWPTPGIYWLNVTATDNQSATPNVTERRMSYTTTLEVPAP